MIAENTSELDFIESRSYKLNEGQLKKSRKFLTHNGTQPEGWSLFCKKYFSEPFKNEVRILEEDLGLNFIDLKEDEIHPMFNDFLSWSSLEDVVADSGLRCFDSMIVNFFSKSKFSALARGDIDFKYLPELEDGKVVFFIN